MSIFATTHLALNSTLLASTAGTVPLLGNPALETLLDAFEPWPELGELIVPIVSTQEGEVRVTPTRLLAHTGASTYQMIQGLAAELPNASPFVPHLKLPQTGGAWRTTYSVSRHVSSLSFRSPQRQVALHFNELEQRASVAVTLGGDRARVTQTVVIQGKNYHDIDLRSYYFKISNVLIEGLGRYLNRPADTSIAALGHSLFPALGFENGPRPSANPMYEEEFKMVEIESNRPGQNMRLTAGRDPEATLMRRHSELIDFCIYPLVAQDRRLTPAQLGLWHWISAQPEPSDEAVEAYHERTKQRYQSS